MAQNEFYAWCFYPQVGIPIHERKHPEKYHFRKLEKFLPFATRKGFIYFNQYQKDTEDFIKKHWIEANFPRNSVSS